MMFYNKLVNVSRYMPQKLQTCLVVFAVIFTLPALAMEKKTEEETKEKPGNSNSALPLLNTFTMLAGMIGGFQTVLNPPVDPQTSAVTETPSPSTFPSSLAFQQARTLMANRGNPSSLFTRASEFAEGTRSSYPNLKTTDYHTMLESMTLSGMQMRPQYFEQLESGEPVSPNTPLEIGFKFFQEFTQGGALDGWLSHLQQKIQSEETNDSNQAMMEFVNSGASLLKLIGSNAINDPTKDPLNKYIDPEDIREAIKLKEWLEQNPEHEEYNAIHVRYMELDEGIRAKREQAIREGGEYIFSLLKRMKPDLAHMKNMSEVIPHLEKQWDSEKRKEFESYILEKYRKTNLSEPNLLRSFWQMVESQQYGKVCYKIVCESYEEQHKGSLLHQTVKQIWLTSQLDTMNEHPKEARSRMPEKSFDGIPASNFGYAMGRSAAYQRWLENPLARASGDIIMDAYHSIVDFGRLLVIDVFLERLKKHLSIRNEADGIAFFSKPHEYDNFLIPFELYLLEHVFDIPFVSDGKKTIPSELIKVAGGDLFKQASYHLNELRKFSQRMFALRPTSNKSKGWEESSGLVFGIGFNGALFDSPSRSNAEDNEICLAFSRSGQTAGGYLLLSLISDTARSRPKNLPFNLSNDVYNKYKSLICHHILKEIENAHYIPGPHWDARMRAYIEQEQAKFKSFKVQLDSEAPYENLMPEFKEWIRQTSNWYYIPHNVKVQTPDEMPFEEHRAQYAAQHLLFDALIGIPFSKAYPYLMSHLFLHWKEEILQKIDEKNHAAIENSNNLDELSKPLRGKVLQILDNLVRQVHPELISVWDSKILKQFAAYMNIDEKFATIDAIAKLSPKTYYEFRREFFKNCKASQCVEPVFARVLGHDRFFPVFISNKPAMAPIKIGKMKTHHSPRLQLGNRIPQDVIAPCNNRCQYHALGHLYTGDMLSYQSADHLDYMRRTHGLGNVPDQFMSFSDMQQYFTVIPVGSGGEHAPMAQEEVIKILFASSKNPEARKIMAHEIVKRLKDGSAPQALLDDPKCKEILERLPSQSDSIKAQEIDSELFTYVQKRKFCRKYINAIKSASDDIRTEEGVLAVLSFLEEEAKGESVRSAIVQNKVGPPKIEGWELKDIEGLGNCFYDAVAHQMEITHHDYLQTVPEGTLARDSLRLLVQGEQFKDREWAEDEQLDELVRKLDVILAFVSTMNPENGYTYYYLGKDGNVETHIPGAGTILPANKRIFKLASTGNHFLSVVREKK